MAAIKKHVLVALVENKPGVLNRMSSLFRRRGFNIEKIAVGRSEQDHLSRMTIIVLGTDEEIEQLRKQIDKVIDVIKVTDLTGPRAIVRELALIKVAATPNNRAEIMQIVDIFRARVVDVAVESLTIEITGDDEKIESLYSLLRPFGIKELCMTGSIAILRG